MLPWFWWYWAPHYELPLSGNINQDIMSDWFFDSIKKGAGDSAVEKNAFHKASYGRQIGLLTEIVLHLVDEKTITKKKKDEALEKLKDIYGDIEKIKRDHFNTKLENAVNELEELREKDASQYEKAVAALMRKKKVPVL